VDIQNDVYVAPKEIGVKMSRLQANSLGVIEDCGWLSWTVRFDDSSAILQTFHSDYVSVTLQNLDVSQILESRHPISCELCCTNNSDEEILLTLTTFSLNNVNMISNIYDSENSLLPNKSITQILRYQSDGALAETLVDGMVEEICVGYKVYDKSKGQLLDQFSLHWTATGN